MIAKCLRRQFTAGGLWHWLRSRRLSRSVRATRARLWPRSLSAPDRSDADRQADKRRDPVPLLAFAGVRPGMKVLDMGAGGGYSTELIARAVAPGGIVYGQNPA